LGSSLNRSSKVNASCPLWDDGASWALAVSGAEAVSFVTACPLKEAAFLPR
jgi:hypothetical protein